MRPAPPSFSPSLVPKLDSSPPSFSPSLAPNQESFLLIPRCLAKYKSVSFSMALPECSRFGYRVAKQAGEFALQVPLFFGDARVVVAGRLFCSSAISQVEVEEFFVEEVEPLMAGLSDVVGEEKTQKVLVFLAFWTAYGEHADLALDWEYCASEEEGPETRVERQRELNELCLKMMDGLVSSRHGLLHSQDEGRYECPMCRGANSGPYYEFVKHVCQCRAATVRVSLGPGFDLIGHDVVTLLLREYLSLSDVKALARCNSAWADRVRRVLKRCRTCGFFHAEKEFYFHPGKFGNISFDAVLTASVKFKLQKAKTFLNDHIPLMSFGLSAAFLASIFVAPVLVPPVIVGVIAFNAYAETRVDKDLQQLYGTRKKVYKKDTWSCCGLMFESDPCCVCRNNGIEMLIDEKLFDDE